MACVAVIAFHARIPGCEGGWLGVDAFFVLSGYLITGLLLDERERTGRIAFGRFYLRRAVRLYPALVVLAVISLLLPTHTSWLHAVFALSYVSDLVLAVDGPMGWMGHSWSLSVEEQFYLVWPLALVLVRGRHVAWLAAAGIALSIAAAVVVDPFGTPIGHLGYFSPVTRGWSILAGCLLAAVLRGRTVPSRSAWPLVGVSVALGVSGLLLAHVEYTIRPQLLTVAATLTFLTAVRAGTRVLSWRPLVWLGRRSYGLYLFAPLPTAWLQDGPWWPRLVWSVVVGVTLAALSYRFVERPIQRRFGGTRPVTAPAPTDQGAARPRRLLMPRSARAAVRPGR
ncbi:acyltransferase family protein [Jatrophihabitans sp. YIM 134969]